MLHFNLSSLLSLQETKSSKLVDWLIFALPLTSYTHHLLVIKTSFVFWWIFSLEFLSVGWSRFVREKCHSRILIFFHFIAEHSLTFLRSDCFFYTTNHWHVTKNNIFFFFFLLVVWCVDCDGSNRLDESRVSTTLSFSVHPSPSVFWLNVE